MAPKSNNATIVSRMPTEEEFWALAKATGYAKLIHRDCVPTALANSLFGVVAIENESIVGTGRLVGDGAIFYYVQDLMVLPKCIKGKALAARLSMA